VGNADPLKNKGYIAADFNNARPVHEVNDGHFVDIRNAALWPCDDDVSAQHTQAGVARSDTPPVAAAGLQLLVCQLPH
jgi:hypothetical protein